MAAIKDQEPEPSLPLLFLPIEGTKNPERSKTGGPSGVSCSRKQSVGEIEREREKSYEAMTSRAGLDWEKEKRIGGGAAELLGLRRRVDRVWVGIN